MMTPSVLAVQGPGKSPDHIQGRSTAGRTGQSRSTCRADRWRSDAPGSRFMPRDRHTGTCQRSDHPNQNVQAQKGHARHLRAGALGSRHRHACAFVGAREGRIKRGMGQNVGSIVTGQRSTPAQPPRDRRTAAPWNPLSIPNSRPCPRLSDQRRNRNTSRKCPEKPVPRRRHRMRLQLPRRNQPRRQILANELKLSRGHETVVRRPAYRLNRAPMAKILTQIFQPEPIRNQ